MLTTKAHAKSFPTNPQDFGKSTLFDDSCLQKLSDCNLSDQLQILTQFKAVPLQKINNLSAFLETVINRYKASHEPKQQIKQENGGPPLSRGVQIKLEQMQLAGLLKVDEIDHSAKRILSDITDTHALAALDGLEEKLRGEFVKNVSAMLVAQIKRVHHMERGRGPPGGGGGGGRMHPP